jgi:hypothetical protein
MRTKWIKQDRLATLPLTLLLWERLSYMGTKDAELELI